MYLAHVYVFKKLRVVISSSRRREWYKRASPGPPASVDSFASCNHFAHHSPLFHSLIIIITPIKTPTTPRRCISPPPPSSPSQQPSYYQQELSQRSHAPASQPAYPIFSCAPTILSPSAPRRVKSPEASRRSSVSATTLRSSATGLVLLESRLRRHGK
jgi:hypothetical protein